MLYYLNLLSYLFKLTTIEIRDYVIIFKEVKHSMLLNSFQCGKVINL